MKQQRKPQQLARVAAAVGRYVDGAEFALRVAQDEKFGKRLFSGVEHGAEAMRRARNGSGIADESVRAELRDARKDFKKARARVDANRQSRRVIRSLVGLTSVAGVASLAAVPQVRERVSELVATVRDSDQFKALASSASDLFRTKVRPRRLENLTKDVLYARAQEVDIPGRSEMSKKELIDALRAKS